ncbi:MULTISPECIES: hypothetical protein [Stenotrophomonas]|uniref:hypothetical protein n=1 Tax=Stenotrophomonas maltophilia TaxID=40324 RepID=UPI0003A64C8F|nr:hypothetical protein [Stenotrophomonas maltophilia]PJL43603.1 hypothetical protein B9Y56_02475 [Stenotrophomonas maltophilia]QGL74717.1 hypothetical protein FEO95_03305 [Stenotrophomonas maltophilia]
MDAIPWLLVAAAGSAIAALLHVGCIVFGAPWYQRFGAGRRMVRLAQAGHWSPAVITAGITLVLVVWALYALAAAGWHEALPASRVVLPVIAMVLLLRASLGFGLALLRPGYNGVRFWVASSLVCLGLGLAFVLGTAQTWQSL